MIAKFLNRSMKQVLHNRVTRLLFSFLLLVIAFFSAHAEEKPTSFAILLKKYVNGNRVSYDAMKNDPLLVAAGKDFSSTNVSNLGSANAQKAFWINAYNYFTLKLICENYPVKSIKDLSPIRNTAIAYVTGQSIWDTYRFRIGDKTYTLNDIEHKILRGQFKDFRIHGAVNCASKSCPPLRGTPYTAQNLDQELDSQMKIWLIDKEYNYYSSDRNELALSKIFDWYASDFKTYPGGLKGIYEKYTGTNVKNAKVIYLEYDWSLNE